MVVVERATIKELTNTITITFDRSFDSVPLFAYGTCFLMQPFKI
jgi:hypothetical protein